MKIKHKNMKYKVNFIFILKNDSEIVMHYPQYKIIENRKDLDYSNTLGVIVCDDIFFIGEQNYWLSSKTENLKSWEHIIAYIKGKIK